MTNAPELIKWAEKTLEGSHVPRPHRNAEELFMHSFDAHREDIYAPGDFKLLSSRVNIFRENVIRRARRFPLQYIIKNVEFMGLVFALEKGIFIPRPETEILVEKALERIAALRKKRINILEIGTGCGNIAISLTKNATSCRIIASDISARALKIAAGNARLHNVQKRMKLIKSKYFRNISPIYYNYFDMLVANPPYIRSAEIAQLQPEIAYEDRRALDGGADGLFAYRRIINDGAKFLKKGGILALETGHDQADAVTNIIEKNGRFSTVVCYSDYNGHKRVLITERLREKRQNWTS